MGLAQRLFCLGLARRLVSGKDLGLVVAPLVGIRVPALLAALDPMHKD